MAGQYGNVRITTQNLKVVKLLEDDDLILIQGSVPGSKNGIVLLKDAVKYKTPNEAPFPAGFRNDNIANKDNLSLSSDQNEKEISSIDEGAEGEN
jgi:large subunit ribosomal protein L3